MTYNVHVQAETGMGREDQWALVCLLKEYGIIVIVDVANALWDDLHADAQAAEEDR